MSGSRFAGEVLVESHRGSDLDQLAQAWDARSTFAFLPERSPSSPESVRRELELLPEEFREGCFVLPTSGSTGEPKLVVGEKRRAEALVGVLHELQASEPVRQAIAALPLSYCFAFVNQWLWSRVYERTFTRTPGFGAPAELATELANSGEAMICLVGIQVPLLAEYFVGKRFPGVIRIHFAGGRFPQEKLGIVHDCFPNAEVFNNYGCAEAMPRLTLRRETDAPEAADVGWPLPGVELRSDEAGQLLFRSPYGAVAWIDRGGFHRIEPETWTATGDLGQEGAQGRWRINGRAGEVFKRHGEKISLPQLMSEVGRVWSGRAAFYRESDAAQEEGHVLVLAPVPSEAEVRSILRVLRSSFSRAHWPIRIESVAEMSLLPNGKLDLEAIKLQSDRQLHWRQRV